MNYSSSRIQFDRIIDFIPRKIDLLLTEYFYDYRFIDTYTLKSFEPYIED